MPYTASSVPSYVPKAKAKQWSAVWNSVYDRAKKDGKSDKEAESSAFAQANGVAGPNTAKKYEKLLKASIEEEARAFADAVIAAIEKDFESLPTEVRHPLESAMLSGIGNGMLQLEVSNAGLLSAANMAAQEYARDRAAELVGMKYDEEGNLVENPDAQWAISDTTREKIREIIAAAFSKETPMQDIKDAIQAALREEANENGIFSEARAELIARTEVGRAQAGGNFNVWQKSGVVKSIRWLTSEDEKVCMECEGNDNSVVPIGKPFPSGDLFPGAHPRCRCVIVVQEVA